MADEQRPQPVLNATQVAAAATWLVGLIVVGAGRYGFVLGEEITGPLTDLVEVLVVTVAGSVASVVAGYWARRRVTPVADPRTADGTTLVPQAPVKFTEPPTEVIDLEQRSLAPDAGGTVNINRLRAEYGLEPY